MNIGARLSEEPVGDGDAHPEALSSLAPADMDLLFVAGCLRKEIDAFLGDFNAFAGSDFCCEALP